MFNIINTIWKDKATALYIFLSVAVVVILVFVITNIYKSHVSSQEIYNTQKAIDCNNSILVNTLKIESSLREYVLLRTETPVTKISESSALLLQQLTKLEQLEKKNKEVRPLIDSTIQMVNERIKNVRTFVVDIERNKLSNEQQLKTIEKGSILSELIKKDIININTIELGKLHKEEAIDAGYDENVNSNLGLLVLIVVVFILLGFLIIRLHRTKDKLSVEIEKSNTLFTNIFRYNPASIAIIRVADDEILNVNDRFIESVGFNNKEEVIGKKHMELDLYVNPEEERELLKLALKDKVLRNVEIQMKNRNGKSIWSLKSRILINIENEPCFLTVFLDITEQKQAEFALQAANKEMEAFTYTVSHDLRAPLRGINGYANAIIEDFGATLDAEASAYMNSIIVNS